MNRKSFLLYCDQSEMVNELSDEQAGKLLKILYEYSCVNPKNPVGLSCNQGASRTFLQEKTELDAVVRIAFKAIKATMPKVPISG